jgi:hypothetical protein
MIRIKILSRNNHLFANRMKVYGLSLEAIFITFFIFIILFVSAVYVKQQGKKKETIRNGTTIR